MSYCALLAHALAILLGDLGSDLIHVKRLDLAD
jgi:hypothetical protein